MKKMMMFIKKIWQKPLARIVTSLVILGLLLYQLPLVDLWQTLRKVSLGIWLMAVAVFMVGHLIGVAKWTLLINIGRDKFPLSQTVQYYFAGLFANLFLPSIAGGDVVRAGLAIRYNSKEKEAVILGSLLDRFLDMVALALLILLGILFSPFSLVAEDQTRLFWAVIILAGAALAAVLLVTVPLPAATPNRLAVLIGRIRNIVWQLISRPQRALLGLGLALFVQGAFVLLNAFLGSTVGIDLPLAVWFLTWPLAKLSATLPISLGGLGVREAALSVFLGRFGVPMAAAVGLGLLWQTVLVAGGALGGIFYFLVSRHLPTSQEFGVVNVAGQREV